MNTDIFFLSIQFRSCLAEDFKKPFPACVHLLFCFAVFSRLPASEKRIAQNPPHQRIALDLPVQTTKVFIVQLVMFQMFIGIVVQHLADRAAAADPRSAVDEQKPFRINAPDEIHDLSGDLFIEQYQVVVGILDRIVELQFQNVRSVQGDRAVRVRFRSVPD